MSGSYIYHVMVNVKKVPVRKAPVKRAAPSPPFPQGLRTRDLKVGMVVRKGNIGKGGYIYTIIESPGSEKVKVLRACPGYIPKEDTFYLGDHGCQPYKSGVWNKTNWLREVRPAGGQVITPQQ